MESAHNFSRDIWPELSDSEAYFLFSTPVSTHLFIMLLQLSHFIPFTPFYPAHPLPPTFPPFSSCPGVIHISSLASTFPILFLPSPCVFSTYHLCYLFSVPFPLSPLPTSPLIILHVISISVIVPVLVVCLVCFYFCLRCGC